jgi:hypothetical protein
VRSGWLDNAVIFTRHFGCDRRTPKRTPTHHKLAVQPRPTTVHPQQHLEDQACVPVVNITGESYRMRTHRAHADKLRRATTQAADGAET